MKTSGIIPIKPWNELEIIVGISSVLSFIAVGEYNKNTPILQINKNNINGTTLNNNDGILPIYFWSIFGPQA
jgi:hypothetical protein